MVAQPEPLAWLDEPYEFWTPRLNREIFLKVLRFEVGLSRRPIREAPGFVIRPTMRLHVPQETKAGRPAYWDWTAQQLIHRILEIYRIQTELAIDNDVDELVARLEETSPRRSRPLTLKIVRRDHDGEIMYEAERVEA